LPGGLAAAGLFCVSGANMRQDCVARFDVVYDGQGHHMTLLNKVFTTRTLMQIIFVLAVAVIMKAASLHYDFSWATALAAG
jgi:hypothetical protein